MRILKIPPKYELNKKVVLILNEIEANKAIIDSVNIPLELEKNIRRESIMGSALFSARIEGNTLTKVEMQSFASLPKKDRQKIEVVNLCRVIEKLISKFSKKGRRILREDILHWQKSSMKGILSSEFSGVFRQGHEGIFDAAGNLVYHAPPPAEIPALIRELLRFTNSKKEKLVLVRAIIAHLTFEKIHPFVDGNGRVGRLLQLAVLCASGYSMKGLLIVEEEIDNNRQDYYDAIESGAGSDCQDFLELMLGFLRDASGKAKENLLAKQKDRSELDYLLPRQKEIALIIGEQKMISFDSLQRRFLKISPRQIAYDLQTLEKKGFIQKIGKTRGALYSAKT